MTLQKGTEVILLSGKNVGEVAIVQADFGDQVFLYQEEYSSLTFFMEKRNLQVLE